MGTAFTLLRRSAELEEMLVAYPVLGMEVWSTSFTPDQRK